MSSGKDEDFGVIALYNLLALRGYEMTAVRDGAIRFRRIHDGAEFASVAAGLESWISTLNNCDTVKSDEQFRKHCDPI